MATANAASRKGILVTATAMFVMAFLIIPLFVVVVQSLTAEDYIRFPPRVFGVRWYRVVVTDPVWLKAIGTSFLVALITTPIALVLGTIAALGLDRGPLMMRKAMRTILIAPMILPHVVLGMAMYRIFLSMRLDDTLLGFVTAHLVLCIPYVIVTVGASLQSFDQNLEQAARSLGAPLWKVLLRITLPLIKPGLIGGAVFSIITSFDEFIVTYFLASRQTTVPIQIFSSLAYQLEPSIAAVSGLTLIVTVALSALLIMRGSASLGAPT